MKICYTQNLLFLVIWGSEVIRPASNVGWGREAKIAWRVTTQWKLEVTAKAA